MAEKPVVAVKIDGAKKRLVAVDATRGVALLGMIAVHSLYESTDAGSPTWSFAVFGGRAAAAFAVLAGVGIAFMTGRKRVGAAAAKPTIAALVTRALAVFAIGLVLGSFSDAALGAVILPYYGVMFLLAVPLVFLPTWLIAVAGAGFALGVPALSHVWLAHLPQANLDNPVFGDVLHQPLSLVTELAVTGEYPALPWMAYLCAGLVVGRLNLKSVKVAAALLASGVVLAVGTAVLSSQLLNRWGGLAHIWAAAPGSDLTTAETSELLTLGGDGTVPPDSWWWLAVNAPHTSTPVDLIGTTGAALALLGLLLLLGHVTHKWVRRVVTAVLSPLAAAGSMTLTLYVAHILFINSDYDRYDATLGYILQVIAVLLIGLCWRATAGRGPLESLVTALAGLARRLASR
ncbi:heparan-alpha-glucosaminide N-acetyltransferase domain-containing protein [Amycolatopsis sp. H20-H5]|uniref:heparan-alpha-glucosaminide N-acetyltransferase domain-containing protein n=1 Tax=Amycolatopsis sp. H20-H5 TaxID=3046309 RepID=UPI002DB79E9E|nr:heparan-alpha-glucosaminide N-acetyltransferase domain-containing protein [Amycolatopsis sp. H20-H5]MEC3978500.1 heparan-alpha-glucosaminide N-acetyltransferase domain-containing protein [Amycolatopsis sp. H20-H5]